MKQGFAMELVEELTRAQEVFLRDGHVDAAERLGKMLETLQQELSQSQSRSLSAERALQYLALAVQILTLVRNW